MEGPYGRRRLYHSRAARDDRDGTSRYRGRERRSRWERKQGGTVELFASPLSIRGEAFLRIPRYGPFFKSMARDGALAVLTEPN